MLITVIHKFFYNNLVIKHFTKIMLFRPYEVNKSMTAFIYTRRMLIFKNTFPQFGSLN